MNLLNINLRIKFRFLFKDIYKLDRLFQIPYPAIPIPIPVDKVLFDERGVYLKVWTSE